MTVPSAAAWAGASFVAAVLMWPGRADISHRLPSRPSCERLAGDARTVYAAADALSLIALALRAGLGPTEALEVVAERVGGRVGAQLSVVAAALRWGEPPQAAWSRVDAAWRPAALAWQAAALAGAAPAGLLDAAARQLRAAEDARVESALQRAGVLLVLPLGMAFLPGFVGTTVVPVVLDLATGLLRP